GSAITASITPHSRLTGSWMIVPSACLTAVTHAIRSPTISSITMPVSTGSGLSIVCSITDVSSPMVNQAMLPRSEEHTSELQSRFDLVCRLLLEKNNDL